MSGQQKELLPRYTARERIGGTPRDMLEPGAEQWCWGTLYLLKRRWQRVEMDHQQFEETLADIDQYRVWERIPPEAPYGSKEALLKAELGVGLDGVSQRVAEVKALDLLDQARGSHQGQRTDLVPNRNEVARPHGDTKQYALRKLRKDRPDLHAEVLSGALSPHGAMVAAGFRPKTISVPLDPPRIAAALRRHLTDAQRAQLCELLA